LLAGKQLFGELKAARVLFERDFPHRRSDERFASVASDEFGGFLSSAAFESEYAPASKRHELQCTRRKG
jgi:hypothetical protein